MTTLRILDGTAWGFNQAKCWKWWQTVMCGGSILSCYPRNPHGHERALKKEEDRLTCDYFYTIIPELENGMGAISWKCFQLKLKSDIRTLDKILSRFFVYILINNLHGRLITYYFCCGYFVCSRWQLIGKRCFKLILCWEYCSKIFRRIAKVLNSQLATVLIILYKKILP